MNYLLPCFARSSATLALMVDVASVVGFRRLLGFKACRILNTAHAVPMVWPAASSPSFVAAAALSPYLQENKFSARDVSLLAFIKDELTLGEKCDAGYGIFFWRIENVTYL